MEFNEFKDLVFSRGSRAGFTDMEIYHQSSKDLSIKVFEGEVDSYTLAEAGGYSFRGLYRGNMGYAYTEVLDEESVDILVRDARENAEVIDADEQLEIFGGSQRYPEISGFKARLSATSSQEKIEIAKAMEAKALALDERVRTVNYCLLASGEGQVRIVNTKGLDLTHSLNAAYAYVSVVVGEGGDTKTFGNFETIGDFSQFDPEKLARGAVEEAVALLGASPVESGEYPVILRWEAAATLLGTFAGIFSAENVQKNFSLLKGKLGEAVAADTITIVDDPLLPQGLYSAPFDAEGVATRTKAVVEAGRLMTFLHNLKTAAKDGVQSTGNAAKGSYKSSVGVAPTNMYIQPGTVSLEDMVAGVQRGLVIIDLQGTHSGANPVSGDFSLGAFGYLVEKGKSVRPVNQITIAGNFISMLRDVEAVGNDMRFGLPAGSMFGSPSLLIKTLAVSGA
jgi:PmbA protein